MVGGGVGSYGTGRGMMGGRDGEDARGRGAGEACRRGVQERRAGEACRRGDVVRAGGGEVVGGWW